MKRAPVLILILAVLVATSIAFLLISINQPAALLSHAAHDDALYLAQARTVSAGQWMGVYNDRVLAKPPGFPIFVAGLDALGIPYPMGVALLRLLAVLVCAAGLWRFTGVAWPAVISVPLLLFHPQVFSTVRILRESIYPSQILLFVGLMLLSFRSRWRLTGFLAAGFAFGWTWITREEGIWMLPGLVVLLAVLARNWRAVPGMLLAFGVGAAVLPVTVGALNQKVYGRWTVSEMGDADFVAATSRLASVTDGGQKSGVGVTRATREAIYAVSPSFAALKPILEAPDYWTFGCSPRPKTCGEIANGWWHWAFRWGAWQAGFHASPATAAKFYRAVADEVGKACDDGRLTCIWRPIPQLPTIQTADLMEMPMYFGQLVGRLFLFNAPLQLVQASSGSPQEMEALLAQLNRPYAFQSPAYRPVFLANFEAVPGLAIRAITAITPIYRDAFYVVAIGTLGLAMLGLARRSRVGAWRMFGVAAALLIFISCRLFLLAIVGVASFATDNLMYIGPAMQLSVLMLLVLAAALAPWQREAAGMAAPAGASPADGRQRQWTDLATAAVLALAMASACLALFAGQHAA
ncbi:hypothetical protein J5J86_00050 [Aquabacter sp. L1I39]|uniref:hypothetical protein n=1 Tax=Aquabacter sp. L1I39 TaxID=2820278 RepID=UPI001ADB56F2|nr:hypothetical protein [Aquabacter sp. L1I39]QTL03817.1 hypothetical protein J5J86_00050 [Aquabacter sp. L1I39]